MSEPHGRQSRRDADNENLREPTQCLRQHQQVEAGRVDGAALEPGAYGVDGATQQVVDTQSVRVEDVHSCPK